MLTVTLSFTPLSADKPRVITWADPQPFPKEWKDEYLDQIRQVEASGPELRLITSSFINLPAFAGRNGPITRWYGDHAKFIIGNLFR
ncbi:hypothetical protein [Hymenobacter glacieicola]|uniref:Glycosyl hydrolase-like 10 domain-containing protein n=1 Tax=Hymenobacter glacieicola TaxID=1562124 RepID=A0ABQ1X6I8_9BACT|nr:hypothetical protein [Hymenobacter glacieicola]GGG61078.1 hypothetical protein GCM10011378_41370 [Hymenobacter glacieicola]